MPGHWDDDIRMPPVPDYLSEQMFGGPPGIRNTQAPGFQNIQAQLPPLGQMPFGAQNDMMQGPLPPIEYNPIPTNWDRDQAPTAFGQGAGSFNLNYDDDGPVGRIDIGGGDQGQL